MARPVAAPLAAAVAAAVLAGCAPPSSDGGQVLVPVDRRIPEVRAARDAVAAPVPELVAEARAVTTALGEVAAAPGTAEERAAAAARVEVTGLSTAADALDELAIAGIGPDVEAVRGVLDELVVAGRELVAAAEAELASYAPLPAFEERMADVVAVWDTPGSYSQQLEAFGAAVTTAEELAEEADEAADGTALPCIGAWERRADAAAVLAARTEELRGLVRDRQGLAFDAARAEFGDDPYGVGEPLGALDAAAATCWAEGSAAPGLTQRLDELVAELEAALAPPDLAG